MFDSSNDRPDGRSNDRSSGRRKDWWRSEMKRRLKESQGGDRAAQVEDANIRIGSIVTEITTSRPGLWLAFSATRHEPLIPAITVPAKTRFESTTRYAFPRMVADSSAEDAASKMNFYVWNEPSVPAVWREHRFGIREPDVSNASWREVNFADVRGALVPGLGFDRRLRRLGRGAGFYDRFLKDSRFLKVGVGFAVQLTDELPHEAHDIELDALVTDRELIWKVDVS